MANDLLKKKIHEAVDAIDDDSILNTVNEMMVEYKSQTGSFKAFEGSPEFAERIKSAEESYADKQFTSHEEVMKKARQRYDV